MSTSEVHAAIQALYGQNAERQKAANAFLVQFASTPAAWETALALLGVADPAVQDRGRRVAHGDGRGVRRERRRARRRRLCRELERRL